MSRGRQLRARGTIWNRTAFVQSPALQPGSVGKLRGKQSVVTHPSPPDPSAEGPWRVEAEPCHLRCSAEARPSGGCRLGKGNPGISERRTGRQRVPDWAAPTRMRRPRPRASHRRAQEGHRRPPRHPPPTAPGQVPAPRARGSPAGSRAEARGRRGRLRGGGAAASCPRRCLPHAELAWPGRAFCAGASDGAHVSALTVPRLRAKGGPLSTLSLRDDVRPRGRSRSLHRNRGCTV